MDEPSIADGGAGPGAGGPGAAPALAPRPWGDDVAVAAQRRGDRGLVELAAGRDAASRASRTSVGGRSPTASPAASSAGPGRSSATGRPPSRTRQRSIRPRTVGRVLRAEDRGPGPARPSSRSATDAVPAGSSCAVGSSRTRTSVPIAMMLAIATRCCSPPESANGSRSARWAMPGRPARRRCGRPSPRAARRGSPARTPAPRAPSASTPTAGSRASRTRSRPGRAGGPPRPSWCRLSPIVTCRRASRARPAG